MSEYGAFVMDDWKRSRIADSAVFVQLYSVSIHLDSEAMAELGLAIMLDKPILLVHRAGMSPPQNLLRVAAATLDLDWDSPEGQLAVDAKIHELASALDNRWV